MHAFAGCNAITFESLDVEDVHFRTSRISPGNGSSQRMNVIG